MLKKNIYKFHKKLKEKKITKQFKFVMKYREYSYYKTLLGISPIVRQYAKKQIYILIKANNIFCLLKDLASKKILLLYSSGQSKLHISKKTLRFNSKIFISNFLILSKKYLKEKSFLFLTFLGPRNIRKKILKQITISLKKHVLVVDIRAKKSFNGCRPKKRRRKKRRGFVILK